MKLYKIITLLSLPLFFSCKKNKIESNNFALKAEINNSILPNDSIKGQAFIGENSSAVNYSPKGNFIKVILHDSGIWKNMILKKSNNIIDHIWFFGDDDLTHSNIYDSLSFGEYQIKYISGFKDTIDDKLEFRKNIELRFPEKLHEFYNEIGIERLKINNLKNNDTLQLLYQNQGCFGNSETLTEFIFTTNDNIVQRSFKESENQWRYIENKNVKENLNDFIDKAKDLVETNIDLCSSDEIYIFRKKNTNKISIINDKSCKLVDEIYQLFDPK